MSKRRKIFGTAVLLMAMVMAFGSCGGSDSSDNVLQSANMETSDSFSSENASSENVPSSSEPEIPVSHKYLTNYIPTYFDKEVTYTEEVICDGIVLVKNSVVKSNDQLSVVYTLEIDLEKVDIHAGSADNATSAFSGTKATPYAQAKAWEDDTGGTVYASINADFFGSTTVNAFVKDGVIIKAGHNDNSVYDYTDTASDVPASAPMLFGVSGGKAQVAPIMQYTGDITTSAVKQSLIQANLGYGLRIPGVNEIMAITENGKPDGNILSFHNKRASQTMRSGVAVKVDITNGYSAMKVLEVQTITKATKLTPTSGKTAYFEADGSNKEAVAFLNNVELGETLSLTVSSPDGTWNGYDTILGCRQALVVDGKVASTVTKENTNGAQSKDVPRSAVGVKEDGTVVLFAVESLYYGKRASDSDGHGMSLPELAEFMYYYGIEDGANFDGGGSTQLVVKREGEATVVVRSSDTGSTEPTSSRVVMNSLLVTSKVD